MKPTLDWLLLNITVVILVAIYFKLSLYVIKQRQLKKTLLGDGTDTQLIAARHSHSNFAQYTPFTLLLLLLLTLENAPPLWLGLLCIMLIVGRCSHIYGMLVAERRQQPSFKYRIYGMKLTFFTLILAALSSLGWVVFYYFK